MKQNPIVVVDARVDWSDDFDNEPSFEILLDRSPRFGPYIKGPTSAAQNLSDEQQAIVGGKPPEEQPATPGWHVYVATDGPMLTMFTYGGKPDRGFGGTGRTIEVVACDACWGSGVERYDDGLPERCSFCKGKPTVEERIAGGWHPGAAAARGVGIEAVNVAYFVDRSAWERGYTARSGFCRESAVRDAIREFCPEVVWTYDELPRFFGQPSKAQWRAMERNRILCERIAWAADEGGEWRGDWRNPPWADMRPYSSLGAAPLDQYGRPDFRWREKFVDHKADYALVAKSPEQPARPWGVEGHDPF